MYSVLIPQTFRSKTGSYVWTGSAWEKGRWEIGPLVMPLSLPQLLTDIALHV